MVGSQSKEPYAFITFNLGLLLWNPYYDIKFLEASIYYIYCAYFLR